RACRRSGARLRSARCRSRRALAGSQSRGTRGRRRVAQRGRHGRAAGTARALVAGERAPEDAWVGTRAVLDWIAATLLPSVLACGKAEIDGLLRGLDGRFVPPGPSGAPSRGRPDVL